MKQVEFFKSCDQAALPAPVQCLLGQTEVQMPNFVAKTRCLITLRIKSSIIRIDSNNKDNVRKVNLLSNRAVLN